MVKKYCFWGNRKYYYKGLDPASILTKISNSRYPMCYILFTLFYAQCM